MKRARNTENQRGEVMLEAAIIFVPVLILLMVMLSLSFFFYQEAMMTSTANEIAADIAKNYKFSTMRIGQGNITLQNIEDANMFRLTFGKSNMAKEHRGRAETYGEIRIAAATLGLNPGDINISCEVNGSGIGRAYVKVTVSQESDYFLSGIMDMVGITEENNMFSSTAYAECVDLLGYTSMVNFTEYASNELLNGFNGIGRLYIKLKDLAEAFIK